jgi:hypothetical protein
MVDSSDWLDRAASLGEGQKGLLMHIASGRDAAFIADALKLDEDDIDAAIDKIVEELELGPFDSEAAKFAVLGQIYTNYCAPEAEAPHANGHDPSGKPRAPASGHKKRMATNRSGVVIELPAGTRDIDVVSGPFSNDGPAPGIKNAIDAREAAGLKPAYLVLTPSTVDPSVTLFQLIFIEGEKVDQR